MELVYFFWILVTLLLAALLIAVLRGARRYEWEADSSDALPEEIIDEEWDLVQAELCRPTSCPRARGWDRRPRQDQGCRICAGLFLQRYWDELLGVPPRLRSEAARRQANSGRAGEPLALPMIEDAVADRELLRPAPVSQPARSGRWGALAVFVGGGALVLGGAAVLGVFREVDYVLYLGYAMVVMGLLGIIVGARAGAL